ncbi:MAG: hypothetical protein JL50_19605 [Peptococcaceae bacterium BICA1-7]|nr:MAG: hypothetical protein JL50_19605 [Peptococcaceae bacterium BICA1-7]HBV98283.1 hypothetical protein [Desulfotomaculum sp.]
MQVKRYGKLAVVLSIMVLFCFVFAGTAMAYPSSEDYDIWASEFGTNVVKASATYDYSLRLKLEPAINVFALGNKPIDIVFPDGFDLSPAEGQTVQVIVNGDRLMQIVPTISGQTATLVLQSQNLPESGEVRKIEIQGLRVTNPCTPDNYCIEVHSPCFDFNCMALKVVQTVGSITLTEPLSVTPVVGGSLVEVKGEVRDACGNLWTYNTWPVIIDIVDLKGRPAIDGTDCIPGISDDRNGDGRVDVICPVIVHPVNGTFAATIKVPGQGYDYQDGYSYDYLVRARTVEVQDIVGDDMNIDLYGYGLNSDDMIPATDKWSLAAELDWKGGPGYGNYWSLNDVNCNDIFGGQDHAWIDAEPQTVTSITDTLVDVSMKVTGDFVQSDDDYILNKPVNVTFCGIDKFCRPTDASGLKVDLLAYQGGEVEERHNDDAGYVAGVFLDASGNQISHVFVPAGQSCVTVTFMPAVTGPISFEGRTIINGVAKVATASINVDSEYQIALEVLPIVTDGNNNPHAGWPLKASVWLQDEDGNLISATEDWEVIVALWENGALSKKATWDTSLNVCFNAQGTKRGFADFYSDKDDFAWWDETCWTDWDTYIHPYCTTKSHFYVYTPSELAGKNLVVEAVVRSKVTGQVMWTQQAVYLVSPVEMVRGLDAETWQTFSTPKYLANSKDCTRYGTFKDLLPGYVWDSETLILSFQNGSWRVISPDSVVEPLMCYYIRTRQPLTPVGASGRNDYWVAKYVFDRATGPSEMVPPVRHLNRGWNSVGLALEQNPLLENGIENPLREQTDFLYHGIGSACDCCKLLWNPGDSVGNLARWSVAAINSGTAPAWVLDPLYSAYNGDNYWMYINCEGADLIGTIGLDLVDP